MAYKIRLIKSDSVSFGAIFRLLKFASFICNNAVWCTWNFFSSAYRTTPLHCRLPYVASRQALLHCGLRTLPQLQSRRCHFSVSTCPDAPFGPSRIASNPLLALHQVLGGLQLPPCQVLVGADPGPHFSTSVYEKVGFGHVCSSLLYCFLSQSQI